MKDKLTKLKEKLKMATDALEEISKKDEILESNKHLIHSEQSGAIFAAASVRRMEKAKNALELIAVTTILEELDYANTKR